MLILEDVEISFGSEIILTDTDLTVEQAEIDCLLGASGCGKTSILRAIAGFQPISRGNIRLQNQIISSPDFRVPPEKRNIGMVFQDYALFPHLTVSDNIAFGIQYQSRNDRQQRITELLDLVQLPEYGQRYPHELSGGQQQRIALARALAPRPKLLLLDEPFGSQDLELREQLAREVRTILKAENITTLLVTHDQHEAYAMADKIGVVQNGKIAQWDSAYRIYHCPADREVADFIGEGAFIKSKVVANSQLETAMGILPGNMSEDFEVGTNVEILLRPDDIQIDPASQIQVEIIERVFRGAEYQYTLKLKDGSTVLMLAPSHQEYKVGTMVGIKFDMRHLMIFKRY